MTFFRCLLLVLIVSLSRSAGAHGLEVQVASLPDDQPSAIVNDRSYTAGEMKTLVSLRGPAALDPTGFVFYGIIDLLDMARTAPAWQQTAREAREAGYELSEEDAAFVDAFVRDWIERELYEENIAENEPRPTVESLRAVYEERREVSYRVPERLIAKALLVPAGPEAEATARELHERLKNGEPFAEVQREYPAPHSTGVARIIIPSEDTVTPAPVLEVLQSLDDRAISEPVKTDEGWFIVQRQLFIPASYMPFESVFQLLLDEWMLEKRRELIREWFDGVARERGDLVVQTQNLLNSGPLALPSDVMLRVGAKELTRKQLTDAGGWKLKSATGWNEELFMETAFGLGPVQDAILDLIIERRRLLETEKARWVREIAADTMLARRYLKDRLEDGLPEPDVEDVRDFASTRLPRGAASEATYDLLALPELNSEAAQRLAAAEDREEFRTIVRETSREIEGARLEIGQTRPLSELPLTDAARMRSGDWPGLLVAGGAGSPRLYWVEELKDVAIPEAALQEARAALRQRALSHAIADTMSEKARTVTFAPLLETGTTAY